MVRVRTGVYAAADFVTKTQSDPQLGEASRVTAALLAMDSTRSGAGNAVASHRSAALIHGLDLLNAPLSDIVTVSRPPGSYRGRARRIKLHSAELPRDQVTERYETPVTTPARTVIDLARTFSFIEGVVVADSALRLQKTTRSEMETVLGTCLRWPGIDRARRVVEFCDKRSESVLESCARVIFHERGLEAPDLQVNMDTSEGIFRVDFYWRKYRTIAEADGRTKYGTPDKARSQLVRDQLLRDTGRTVVHFTWQELFYEEDRLIRRLTTAFSSA